MIHTGRTRISKILTIIDHDTEVVRSFKYMGTAVNNTNDETEEIKARKLLANKAYFSLQTIFRLNKSTKIIHGPIQDKQCRRPQWNSEVYNFYKDPNILDDIKLRRLG